MSYLGAETDINSLSNSYFVFSFKNCKAEVQYYIFNGNSIKSYQN